MDTPNGDTENLAQRVEHLEKKVQDQENEIVILKSCLSEVLRKLAAIETCPMSSKLPVAPLQKLTQSRHYASSVTNKEQKSSARGVTAKQPSPASPKSLTDMKKWPASEGIATCNSIRNKLKERGDSKDSVEGILKFQLRGRPLTFIAPSALGTDFLANTPNLPPKEKLTLEWVYGYRGKDARSNVFFLPTGEVVYFVAAVAVLFNIEEQTQRHYYEHTDDIKCLAVHPDKVTIATGQVAGHDRLDGKTSKKSENFDKWPHVRVWSSITLQTLKVIGMGYFEVALACISFSKQDGGMLLAAVDDSGDHVLSVWDWQKGNAGTKVAENKSSGDPVLFAEFHPCDSNTLVLCGKGQISFWTMEGSVLSKKTGIFEGIEKPKYVTCLAFAENGEVISGDSSGNLCIWGKGTNKIKQPILAAHEGGIFSICSLKDGNFLSGGKDRKIIKWENADEVYQKIGMEHEMPELYGPARHLTEGIGNSVIVGTTKNAILQGSLDSEFVSIVQGHTEELWGLAEHPSQNQFMTCGHDKVVCMWDSLTHRSVWCKDMPESCHAVAIHPSGQVATVSGNSPRWYVLNLSTHEVMSSHLDASERVECMQFSPDGSMLACGSRDNCIYVYSISQEHKFSKVAKLNGHSSFVLHIDWSSDGMYLQSNSGDYELLFWNMETFKQVLSPSSLRDVEWASSNCTLQFSVCGMWPKGADGTDINACTRSHKRGLLASADDFGRVSLLNFPCFLPGSQRLVYLGHSSHVTNAKFLHDDTRLISVGGKDAAIIQWQVVDAAESL